MAVRKPLKCCKTLPSWLP